MRIPTQEAALRHKRPRNCNRHRGSRVPANSATRANRGGFEVAIDVEAQKFTQSPRRTHDCMRGLELAVHAEAHEFPQQLAPLRQTEFFNWNRQRRARSPVIGATLVQAASSLQSKPMRKIHDQRSARGRVSRYHGTRVPINDQRGTRGRASRYRGATILTKDPRGTRGRASNIEA